MPFSPATLALLIVLAVAVVGVLIAAFRRGQTFKGYEELREDVRYLAHELKADVFRDGDDLVLSGGRRKLPLVVRFSHAENTPGLLLRAHAPVGFTYSAVPKGATASEGRVPIRTGSDMFDTRFVSRTDQPTQARLFLSNRRVMTQIEKLCCSSKTFLTMGGGRIEVTELVIPEAYPARHIADHVRSLEEISKALAQMPGAETVKVPAIPRERSSLLARVAIVVGAIAAIGLVVTATRSPHSDNVQAQSDATAPEGIDPADAQHMLTLRGWRAVHSDEIDPNFAQWTKDYGVEAGSRVEGSFADQPSHDVAYFLIKNDGTKRVSVLIGNRMAYDSGFKDVAGIVRLPKSNVLNANWASPPDVAAQSDALMIVQRADDPASAIVLYFVRNRAVTATPKDYKRVGLQ